MILLILLIMCHAHWRSARSEHGMASIGHISSLTNQQVGHELAQLSLIYGSAAAHWQQQVHAVSFVCRFG